MQNSFSIGYFPEIELKNDINTTENSKNFNKKLILGSMVVGSFTTILNDNNFSFPAATQLKTNFNQPESTNFDKSEYGLMRNYDTIKVNKENGSINRKDGVFMEYNERIEYKIDDIQKDLTDQKISIVKIEKDIQSLETDISKIPDTIESTFRKIQEEDKKSITAIWVAPAVISLIGIIITAIVTWYLSN